MAEKKEVKEVVRPSVRNEKEFYKDIQKKMIDEDTDFQNLVIKLLAEWVES